MQKLILQEGEISDLNNQSHNPLVSATNANDLSAIPNLYFADDSRYDFQNTSNQTHLNKKQSRAKHISELFGHPNLNQDSSTDIPIQESKEKTDLETGLPLTTSVQETGIPPIKIIPPSSTQHKNDSNGLQVVVFRKTLSFQLKETAPPSPLTIHINAQNKSDSEQSKSENEIGNVSPGLKRWRKLSIIVKSINAFQKNEIKNLNPSEIEYEIKKSISPRKIQMNLSKNLDNDMQMSKILDGYRRVEELCIYCSRGSSEDIESIKQLLNKDPKRYIRSTNDPEHLLNRSNRQGFPPLYVACQNQNIEVKSHNHQIYFRVIKFLLKLGSIPNIKSKNDETCLEVSARWRFINVINILLEHQQSFDTKDIKASKAACEGHPEISALLQSIIFKRSNNIFKYCLPCLL